MDLRDGEAEAQRAELDFLIRDCRRRVGELAREAQAVDKINKRFLTAVGILEGFYAELDGSKPVPSDDAVDALGLPGKTTVGKNAETGRADLLEAEMAALLAITRQLPHIDLDFTTLLLEALGPFREKFYRSFLERGRVSFDALIVLARDLLKNHPGIRREESRRFDHLLVDEFQDNDPLQYEIAFFLSERLAEEASSAGDPYALRLEPGKLFIVGDPKQSIYRFRGADMEIYGRAVKTLGEEGALETTLRTNFRSVPELVEPLNTLFDARFSGTEGIDPEYHALSAHRAPVGDARIEIWSVGKPGLKAQGRREHEARVMADWILLQAKKESFHFRDVAILLRALGDVEIYLRALRERGIPLVVEGGKGFYERQEVALLLAFLRAIVNSADRVSLVGWLRSPAAAVPDIELQRFSALGFWSLHSEPDPKKYPNLARALVSLRDFRARHRGQSLDTLARAAMRETPLCLAMAVSHGGAQRVVNLRKAVRRIAELAREGFLSNESILTRIESVEARERSEGNSPLADESVDAVRVFSVHKSKGLEWPIVILPDLARGTKPPPGSLDICLSSGTRESLRPCLVFRSRRLTSAAFFRHEREQALHEEAEQKRVLYVAMTRARERLVLVNGPPKGSAEKTWMNALGPWGYHYETDFPDAESFLSGAIIHRVFREPGKKVSAASARATSQGVLRAVERFEKARAKAGSASGEWLRSPSELAAHATPTAEASAKESKGETLVPRAVGTAAHQLLESWDQKRVDWLFENAEKAARLVCCHERLPLQSVLGELRAVLDRAQKAGVLERLAGLPFLERELPLICKDAGGRVWNGAIDLVVGTPQDPSILDYKASRNRSAAELEKIYGDQLECYRTALSRALGGERQPNAGILPL